MRRQHPPVRLVASAAAAPAPAVPSALGGRIAVIGGGFYGCHIAETLLALGFEVSLFEKSDRLLSGASGANQFRLHLGFHYARSFTTRMQSRDGFYRFIQHYPELTAAVPENIYAVSRDESLLDYETYRQIMVASSIPFEEIEAASVPITGVSGMMRTEERVLLLDRARRQFEAALRHCARTGHAIEALEDRGDHVLVDGERFDYAIDATWGHLRIPDAPVFYEPTLMLYYRTTEPFPAVTMVDGPLYSVYPTEEAGVFTLSSVTETPLGQFSDPHAAVAVRDGMGAAAIQAKRRIMERQIHRYLPDFGERFAYVGPQLSLKTKLAGASDSRSCSVSVQGRILSVISGKIDAVFHATERVLEILEVPHAGALAAAPRVAAI